MSESVRVDPGRPSRSLVLALAALVVGVVAGALAVLGWQQDERSTPAPARAARGDEHDVELLLYEVVPAGRGRALRVHGGLLQSGGATSTVVSMGSLDGGLEILAPRLPVTVSPTARYRTVTLTFLVGDCRTATGWTPGERPFTLTWRDEYGDTHLDRGGDFDPSVGTAIVRYVDAACGTG